jgi:hypothetical protein
LQRSRRRPKGREDHCGTGRSARRGTCSAGSTGRTGRARQERRSDDLRGWQYKYVDRQGHVQRPWWRTESHQGCTCEGGSLERTRCRSGARRCSGRGRSSSSCGDSAGSDSSDSSQISHGDQVGADCDCRQYRSHGCDGQVQGRHLLEVGASQRYLLEPRRRRHLVDRGPVDLAAGLFAQQRLQRRPDVLEQLRLPESVRMNVIVLHEILGERDVVQQKRHQGDFLVAGDIAET